MSRYNSIYLLFSHQDLGYNPNTWLSVRYAFLSAVNGCFFWFFIYNIITNRNKKFALNLLLLIPICFYVSSYFKVEPTRLNLFLYNTEKIKYVLENKEKYNIEIPIEPNNWQIKIGNGSEKISANQ